MSWQAVARICRRLAGQGRSPVVETSLVTCPRVQSHAAPPATNPATSNWADWHHVVNDARFFSAKSAREEMAEDTIDREVRSWLLGTPYSDSAQMALQLREHFGVRAPVEANHLMGERWLLDRHCEEAEVLTPQRGQTISLAVRLWTTPTVVDAAIGGQHFHSGW